MSRLQQPAALYNTSRWRLSSQQSVWTTLRSALPNLFNRLWNRKLPPHIRIEHRILWPLLLTPLVLFSQIVTPHPVWVVLTVALFGLYGVAIVWVRNQATTVTLTRKRLGAALVAGDQLEEEFVLHNHSALPVLWAEVHDHGTIPNYQTGRVVGCGSNSNYRWNTAVICRRRGVYRLGPQEIQLADPIGLMGLTIHFPETETIIIYPRVLRLPAIPMPEGSQSGTARKRRPLLGNQPSAAVRAYQPTDSLRHVHWPITAHRGELMVIEMESEPSGDVWVLLDLDQSVQRGEEDTGTFEYSIVAAASLTAELLQDDDRRAVGLYTISGPAPLEPHVAATTPDEGGQTEAAIILPPQSGQAQLWHVLASLAPVHPSQVTLTDLLRSARASLGKRATIIVVTPHPAGAPLDNEVPEWLSELVHLQGTGIHSSVVWVTEDAHHLTQEDALEGVLSRYGIEVQTLLTTAHLPTALTFRRTRRVIRSTPTGGAVSIEVEEEVG